MRKLLFTSWAETVDSQREKEYNECVERNRKFFDMVYVLRGERTVQDLIDRANGCNGDVSVIANADVYFDRLDETDLASLDISTMYALTRYEGNAFFCREDSSDAWIFRGKIGIANGCDFRLGLRGTDNAICNRAEGAGYHVINPSLTVRINHLHQCRKPNNRYAPPPYDLSVRPTTPLGAPLVFATSICPSDRLDAQRKAVDTWRGHNTVILSFNSRHEIDALSSDAAFRDVVFIEATSPVKGKYVRIYDILQSLKKIDAARYILINSDIRIEDRRSLVDNMLRDSFILGVRHDIKGTRTSLFEYGYDVFCFRRRHLMLFNRPSDYALGLPFHDFYTPLTLIAAGERIDVDRSHFYHEWHKTRYDYREWQRMAAYSKRQSCFKLKDKEDGDFTAINKQYIEDHLYFKL